MLGVTKLDPYLSFWKNQGFEIYKYTPREAPWGKALPALQIHLNFLGGLAVYLYFCTRLNAGVLRGAGGLAGLLALLAWPAYQGRSGLGAIDYGMPAYGFLSFLHIMDVFFLRPASEVHSWGFARTYCQLFAFPNEKSTTKSPRLENAKVFGLCAIKYVGANLLLYVCPPPEVWRQLKPLSLPYFFHAWATGSIIMLTLGFYVEFVIRLLGFIFGIEQGQMFANPFFSSNIREFWSRWNIVIKDGLNRVFFKFKPPKRRGRSANGSAASGQSSAVRGRASSAQQRVAQRKQFNDHLSETEMSASEVESRPSSPVRKAKEAAAKAPRTRSAFLPKALMAMVTFAASGAFHEWMNRMAFPEQKHGETILFFLVQGFATVVYSYIGRTTPKLLSWCPKPLGILLTNIFLFVTIPLFVAPMLRQGFFEDLKAIGIFGPVRGFIWLLGDGHGRHVPKVLK